MGAVVSQKVHLCKGSPDVPLGLLARSGQLRVRVVENTGWDMLEETESRKQV